MKKLLYKYQQFWDVCLENTSITHTLSASTLSYWFYWAMETGWYNLLLNSSRTAVLWICLGNWPRKQFHSIPKMKWTKEMDYKGHSFPSFPLPPPRGLWKPLPPPLYYYGKYHLINSSYKARQQPTFPMYWLQETQTAVQVYKCLCNEEKYQVLLKEWN